VAVAYNDFPTVEWTVYFKNTGTRVTPILEDIEALDTRLERSGEGEFVLHHSKGAPATPSDYQPFQTVLGPKAEQRLSAAGGRPTNKDMSYFNVAWPGEGVIIAVGWPGQWAAQLRRDEGNGLQVRAGQELTHFELLPGEEVRTPLIVMQFYKGDWLRAQNIWRRWMLAYNLPRPGGKLPPPQFAATSSHAYTEMQGANEGNQEMFIDRYLAGGLKLDYWWMDAGWYVNNGSWVNTGTWEPDPKKFPHGLRAVSDYAHSKGVAIILWFEPERVTKGTWLCEHHPEWLLKPPPNSGNQGYDPDWRLLNLGNPEAWMWLTDHVDNLIKEQGIDLYRQDFNIDPLLFWRANDTEDRQGITEIRYVTGYLAYWDELRHRHPHMLIDSCASGGRRNDLETMRRAVPLTRSDYLLQIEKGEPLSQQSQTYGMALWLPYFGTGINGLDAYTFRSQMCPALAGTWDLRSKEIPYDLLRRLLAQWRRVGNYYFGDYYPLTPYSLATDVWLAWQFDRPDLGEGMVQTFRRSNSSYESARFKLRGLDPEARYAVDDVDAPGAQGMTGRELMEHGLMVNVKDQPGAAIILYKRVEPGK
jgi:alpha-galactosidase